MYSVTIALNSLTELQSLCQLLHAAGKTPTPMVIKDAPAEEAAEKKSVRKTTEKKEVVKEESAPVVSYDKVREATFKLAAVPGNGPSLVREVLATFNVDHATKLTDTQWGKYVDIANKKLEENTAEENLA